MKKKLLFAGVAFMALSTMQAQDGIGIGKSIIPDGTAVLDVGSDTKGVLIPRVFLTGEKDITTIKGGIYPESLLVYHKAKLPTDVLKSGFYFWDGTLWRALMSKSSEHLSETLTKLSVKQEAGETVLVYKAEDGKDTEIEISKELQSSTNFETWIKDLVTSAATKVKVEEGTGIKVDEAPPVNGQITYTVNADPSGITLGGDVSGKADSTSVDKIKGVEVAKANPATDKDLALVYDGTKWTPGKPKVDGNNITDKKELKVLDGISITNGTASVLNDVTIGIGDNSVMPIKISAEDKANQVLVTSDDGTKAEWVPQSNIKPAGTKLSGDASIEVTDGDLALVNAASIKVKALGIEEGHIANNAVSKEKIKGEGNDKVLTTNATGGVEWALKSDIKPAGTKLSGDASIEVTDGDLALVNAASIKVKALGIEEGHIANNAVSKEKIKGEGNDKVLTTNATGGVEWALKSDIKPAGTKLSGDASIEVTDGDLALVNAASIKVKALGIEEGHIANNAVSKEKIKGEGNDKVLTTNATGGVEWALKSDIKPAGTKLSGDASIEVTDGDLALVNAASIKVKALGIEEGHIANNAVSKEKIKGEGNDKVLTTNATGGVEWALKSDIKPTKADLTTDGIIVVGDATTGTQLATGALLEGVNLSIKKESIDNDKIAPSTLTIDKLATVPEKKNMHLVTDINGKPQWETLKGSDIKITTKPIATNETVEGQRVYTVRIINGEVETPPGTSLTYNSEIKAIPLSNIDYLLTAHIYDSSNKLLINGVTDVTNSKNTSVKFRFGSGNFYNTLPVAKNYIVVLKYVSTEIVTP
ncbi:hypothetical protein QK342_00125 [Myroides odoratimimus]|uniref:hypothetical protein n=2 Tax=Myroides odoratimimus TaxID=76832 RepID=UPI0024C0C6A0|nr:hypothetical protein [Myroides odoratimimus]WHT73556.1 hypothetical protein QK342_00125 [Myroides odoratimimus]WHU38138.1 hypothetical protein QNM93_00125 [Myroides odoratimimus]